MGLDEVQRVGDNEPGQWEPRIVKPSIHAVVGCWGEAQLLRQTWVASVPSLKITSDVQTNAFVVSLTAVVPMA